MALSSRRSFSRHPAASNRPGGAVILSPLDPRRLFVGDSPFAKGAFLLCCGALIMACGGLAGGLDRLHLLGSQGIAHTYFPWSLWTGSLILLGAGFLWVGFAPGFSRFGLVVALAHFLQAAYVLLTVTQHRSIYLPPESVALVRLAALLFFAVLERSRLSSPGVLLIATAAVLQISKIFLRVLEVLPAQDVPGLVVADTVLALLLAGAIYLIGVSFSRRKEQWEVQQGVEDAMELEEFNNPEHPWNKE